MRVAILLLCVCASLSACGQKGPLYLPQSDKPAPEKAVPEKTQP